ncbi:hypothetical protein NQ176_g1980 [Zarea fungicola]|uniref:Uncharacterized protein n=1 Tax=Zarea fungicola TaxID=93591 RepID=A0ACC1NSR0_9HYPO|nr:hypothetical protein NQ176_g1980 [Lecanicillium fungicola]
MAQSSNAGNANHPTGQELVTKYSDAIRGKVILTTGVSPGGLGATFVEAVAAAQPALLILAGRNPSKCQKVADTCRIDYAGVQLKILELDLSSFSAVRKAAAEVLSWTDVPAIDILVNNAGIMAVPFSLSTDGYESQFASNHLGQFLFTNLIMPKLLAVPSPRIISNGALYDKWVAYGQSKTANILFAVSLAQKLGSRGLLAFSLHPGAIITNLGTHLDRSPGGDLDHMMNLARSRGLKLGFYSRSGLVSRDKGIATHVFACFEPTLSSDNGKYLQECRIADPYEEEVMPWATSKVEAARLWAMSEAIVGQRFTY